MCVIKYNKWIGEKTPLSAVSGSKPGPFKCIFPLHSKDSIPDTPVLTLKT